MADPQMLLRQTVRDSWLKLGLMLVAVAGLVAWSVYSDYRGATFRAQRNLETQANVIEKNLVAQLDSTIGVLQRVRAGLPKDHGDQRHLERLSGQLVTLGEALPGVRTLLLMDARGTVLAANRRELIGRNFAERAYFQAGRDGLDVTKVHLGAPFKTVLGVWGMNLVLRVESADGQFAGIVAATLDTAYFETLLGSVQYAPDLWASIIHGGGLLFTFVPHRAGVEGKNLMVPESLFTRHQQSGRAASLLTGMAYTTGEQRMMALRTIRPVAAPIDSPLVVAVSRDLWATYTPWRERAAIQLSLLAVFMVFAVIANAVFQRRKQHDAALIQATMNQLENSEKKFRVASDNARDAFIIIDGEKGCITWWNAAAESLFGFSREEVMGQALHDFICPPDTRALAQQGLAKFATSGEGAAVGQTLELSAQRKDGTGFPIELSLSAMQVDGNWYGVGIARDISARKQAEAEIRRLNASLEERVAQRTAELQESERRFSAVFQASPIAITLIQMSNGRYVEVNDAALAMFGFERAEIIGRTCQELDIYNDPQDHVQMIRLLEQDGHVRNLETQLRRKTGGVRRVLMSVEPIEVEGRSWQLSMMLDITARAEAEEALRELNKSLAQRVADEVTKSMAQEHILIQQARHAALGEMIGNIAHQWRQPLSHLGLVVQNIGVDFEDKVLDQEGLQEYIDKAMHSIQLMSKTIDDFRDFFRPDQQKGFFDINEAVRDALSLVAASLQSNNIKVIERNGADIQVWGNQNALAQVLVNLIGNAKEALVQKRSALRAIEIETDANETQATIKVRDNAGGIPDDFAEKIFDPYFTTKENGTGIGLYMARTIVERHMQGTLRFRNSGEGAEFIVTLPAGQASRGQPASAA